MILPGPMGKRPPWPWEIRGAIIAQTLFSNGVARCAMFAGNPASVRVFAAVLVICVNKRRRAWWGKETLLLEFRYFE